MTSNDTSRNFERIDSGPLFGHSSFDEHEQIIFFSDKDTGLKAIIGIHNSVLGPALGGVRMMNYANENEALNDVLRLSRGMTFKSAITGLNLGGGKAVIIGDPKTQKTPELIKRFAECVHSLGGHYITTEDVGTTPQDMDLIRKHTPYVAGISESNGGTGNPAPISAFGVFMGMKAAAKFKFDNDVLEDKVVFVQGIGQVGEALIENLMNEGAKVTISDINKERMAKVAAKYGVTIYDGDDIFSEPMDIYAPCALGATINDDSISRMKASIIAGSANNQLQNEARHGKLLQDKGILYAPDFLINAGGLINVYAELENYDKQEVMRKTENIYNTTLETLKRAKAEGIGTNLAAMNLAKERIATRKLERSN
ncbi:Glu/Leu/Phe/Val dehydrogenase [Sediminibacter sp. Hel_I_10]|uniref:Glu/Leu/Phe/Val family dehydrogenase n=1 Tax=Sediminibacter sp. Hel_I_10 TaxID=1392490 RepID=UPI0004786B8D|nr:Glu/Leu/Phe/Val dehydrogenase [Sediminibacter sp. Hel_I_10]